MRNLVALRDTFLADPGLRGPLGSGSLALTGAAGEVQGHMGLVSMVGSEGFYYVT